MILKQDRSDVELEILPGTLKIEMGRHLLGKDDTKLIRDISRIRAYCQNCKFQVYPRLAVVSGLHTHKRIRSVLDGVNCLHTLKYRINTIPWYDFESDCDDLYPTDEELTLIRDKCEDFDQSPIPPECPHLNIFKLVDKLNDINQNGTYDCDS